MAIRHRGGGPAAAGRAGARLFGSRSRGSGERRTARLLRGFTYSPAVGLAGPRTCRVDRPAKWSYPGSSQSLREIRVSTNASLAARSPTCDLMMQTTHVNDFFHHLGFVEDPFQSTNASDEPRIHEYFIEPPYFASVLGDPAQPRSQVILAPRGGGKTAQRIMVERDASKKRSYLCITYDHFDAHFASGKLKTNLELHLFEISKYILIALLLDMAEKPGSAVLLEKSERAILRWEVDNWLNTFSPLEFETTVKSLSTWSERLGDIWRRYSGQISSLISAVAAKYDFGAVDISSTPLPQGSDHGSVHYLISQQVNVASKLGYQAIYVLVDRIDETTWTNQDADASFQLIQPIVTDLQTLETQKMAFKFFLVGPNSR